MILQDQPHRTSLSVRGYELDSYGHVNNAVYLQYLEQARWVYMRDHELLDQINQNELFLVVTETRIRYMREANLLDEITIETTLKEEKPYLVFRHQIKNAKTGLLLSRASVKTIFVNKQRMALDTPDFILTSLSTLR
ncbi:MAG: thioesterase family protein [Bacteroidetes bacterium]|nr:thioesterase family protein [Bacteroidota bacterium]